MLDNTTSEFNDVCAQDSEHDKPRQNNIPNRLPVGSNFSNTPESPRLLDPGMGIAVARRTVFRPNDQECFGKVADRVARGNMSLLKRPLTEAEQLEEIHLRNAIATGALPTAGRHLQHGDANQYKRNIELCSNCATAIASCLKFYLLLNGAGVGRSYDDQFMIVNWHKAPNLMVHLSKQHKDYPYTIEQKCAIGVSAGVLPYGSTTDPFGVVDAWIADNFIEDLPATLQDGQDVYDGNVRYHLVHDSREGWAKAFEIYEAMAYQGLSDHTLVLDFSVVREAGSPIAGMQDRPASGPLSVINGFLNVKNNVVRNQQCVEPWLQALRVDHYLSVEVQVGGARRAARIATKYWRDPGILDFIMSKSKGGLWTANHSVMVDKEFWDLINLPLTDDPWSIHAHKIYDESIRCLWINGEPGFINVDMLEGVRTGQAHQKPVCEDGSDFSDSRYQLSDGKDLLIELTKIAQISKYPVTVNPCGEIEIHVTGGLCIIADHAPLLACPVDFNTLTPGHIPYHIAKLWDDRVEDAVRLGVRFLIRVNTMEALYGNEVKRTNRIGIGPTGLHEYAWMRFGYDFYDLIDENKSYPFWQNLLRFSNAAKEEADSYADELGMTRPFTVTTSKPSGSISKLFGITEGVHLLAHRYYLRNVQFKGTKDFSDNPQWDINSDPLLKKYEDFGYPVRQLKTFDGMSIVGFPTVPLIMRLGIGDRAVTASEATPEEQYEWLRLLEKYWIGKERGNQISYTLKVYTDRVTLDEFHAIVKSNQKTVRCCSILPTRPDKELGYEYLPEEEVSFDKFVSLVNNITDAKVDEAIDIAHLQCISGACPI